MLAAQSQIQDLVQQKLLARQGSVVEFVDDLLVLVGQVTQVRCTFVKDRELLRFEIPGQEPWEVAADLAKGRLRTACARLGVLCNESGNDVSLYGGEGVIKEAAVSPLPNGSGNHRPRSWNVCFQNTTQAQEFTITAVEDSRPCP